MTCRRRYNSQRPRGLSRLMVPRAAWFTCLMAGLLILLCSAVAQAQNLISDPSFETGSPPWQLLDSNSSIVTSQFRTGSKSLRLDNDGSPSNHNVWQTNLPDVVGGTEYEYRVWVRGVDVTGEGAGGKPLGIIRWRNSSGDVISPDGRPERYVWAPYGTYGWTQLRMNLEAPANAARVDAGFRAWAHCLTGSTFWDDISLVERDFSNRGSLVATYQAQDATSTANGSMASTTNGFTGTGYFIPNTGQTSSIEWNNVEAPSAGPYLLVFRYSLEGWEKPWQVSVNTVNQGPFQPVQTGWPNSWATFEIPVELDQGNNTIRANLPSYTGADPLRVDRLDLFQVPTVAAPTITPDGGTFSESVEVSLETTTADAVIYYTTDGSTPGIDDTEYTAPFYLSADATVKAFAVAAEHADSPVAIADFIITAAAPTITPDGGTFSGSVEVSLATGTPGGTIHYTIDDTTPTNASPVYTGPFTLSADATVQAFAAAAGYSDSAVVMADFTVTGSAPTAAAPTITPDGGTFSGPVEVSLATSTPGATIHYTTDGSDPVAASPVYAAPFTLNGSATVKAFSVAAGYGESPVVGAVFSIDNAAVGGSSGSSGGGGCFINALK